jgi:DNA (cytosine-5)-methyltransferase 1
MQDIGAVVRFSQGTHGYHYSDPRRLTNREKARLQTFPDSFVFADGGAGRSAYPRVRKQIGNAVPPRAAQAFAEALVGVLDRAGVSGRTARELTAVQRKARREAELMTAQPAAAA